MNKTILGLIAAVIVLGAALVLFNNGQKPEAVQNPKTELPALPDLAAERAARNANLKELPTLPEAVENSASVRAPIVAQNTNQAKAADAVTAQTQSQDSTQAQKPQEKPQGMQGSSSVARGTVAPRPAARTEPVTVADAEGDTKTAKPAREDTPKAAQAKPAREDAPKAAQAKPAKEDTPKAAQAKPAREDEPKAAQTKPAREDEPKTAQAKQAKESADEDKSSAQKPASATKPKLAVLVRDKGATVRLNLGQTIAYKQMLLENPYRVVIDVTGSYRDLRAPGIPDNPLVTNVRLGHYNNRTRIVVDLSAKPSSWRVILSEDKDRLDIRVDR